jgi:CheY-like chemotaxis protein
VAPTHALEAAEPSQPAAVILIVASDDLQRAGVLSHLRRRYLEDYDIHVEGSAPLALQRLESLRDDGRDLAIMLVDWRLSDGKGMELLSRAQAFPPARHASPSPEESWPGGRSSVSP